MPRFILRPAHERDAEDLSVLAGLLNSFNLPKEKRELLDLIYLSNGSFCGTVLNPKERKYVWVLEDTTIQKAIGTSQITAKHGTPELPHLYFHLKKHQTLSETLGLLGAYHTLELCADSNGPTELGGLILHPTYRHQRGLGKLLSFGRFMFIGAFSQHFETRLITELLPPFYAPGKSALWDALGAHFIDMDYAKSDRISKYNKEFILSLFPKFPICVELLPKSAQEMIGKVGEATKPAQKLLESIGFTYEQHLDPFDGGPHYEAETAQVSIIKKLKRFESKNIFDHKKSSNIYVLKSKNMFTDKAEATCFIFDEIDKMPFDDAIFYVYEHKTS